MMSKETYADKIAKLLRKAESTQHPAEAELLMAKAQELMVTYAIDEEMLARIGGEQRKERDVIVEESIEYTGLFRDALRDIGSAIARANDCRILVSSWPRYDRDEKTSKTMKVKVARLHVIGFSADVRRVHMLNASLQIQATTAQLTWWRAEDRSHYSRQDAWQSRRTFLFGFANGLNQKLQEARRVGEAAAVKNQEARGDAAASDSVALVLRDKRTAVNDWIDTKYGNSLRNVSRNYKHGSGYGAGQAAGRNADTGNRMGGGARKELGR